MKSSLDIFQFKMVIFNEWSFHMKLRSLSRACLIYFTSNDYYTMVNLN